MSALGDKLRRAREFKVEVDGMLLVCRRPSEAEFARLQRDEASGLDIAAEFVIGWEAVTEADLVPSGGSDPVGFDVDTWREVLGDRHALWQAGELIRNRFLEYFDAREARAKN